MLLEKNRQLIASFKKKAGGLCEQLRVVGPLDELKTASTTEPQLHNNTS